ncbi:transposase [uncultured Oxalicibacterium sp.]|uniref:REP-associated tyrosine transposase n=1 Tax=uncultured Oxalicibacterium sp. TaxID=1168540 RepID=UPI0025F0EB89|nr:transposase [uncultured Oxalicibacterium sp.]
MARLPRLVVPHQPHHVIQRGVDRQVIFHDTADHLFFLACLRDAARRFQVAIHAYVLMPNHLHLLVTPADQTGLARMMQWIGRHYVPHFNQKYHRSGTLWQGRYRTAVLDAERYLMLCSRYIDLNPVRAGLVAHAGEYPWSSYQHHVGIKSDALVTDHALYWALGNTPFEREAAYKRLIEEGLDEQEVRMLSEATLKGWALGSDQFKNGLEKQAKRRVQPSRRGRPARDVLVKAL